MRVKTEQRPELPTGLFWHPKSRFIYFDIERDGKRHRKSTKTANVREAQRIYASWMTKINRSAAGLERDPFKATTLADFRKRFEEEVAGKSENPDTRDYYHRRYTELLQYPGFECGLDEIDEEVVDGFVQWKLKQKSKHGRSFSRASVNHCLRTLKRALRLAYRWRQINRVPAISLLSGENEREAVLPPEREQEWLDAAPEPLRTYGPVCLDQGLRFREYSSLLRHHVIFDTDERFPLGYVQVRRYQKRLKSHYSNRDIPLTRRAREILLVACEGKGREDRVFRVSKSTLEHQNRRVRDELGLGREFVLHSFRHSFGTRLGEAGAQASHIKQLMGHATLSVSQKYVHKLTDTSIAALMGRLDAANQANLKKKARPARAAAAASGGMR